MGLASNDTFNNVVPAGPLTWQEQEHKELKGQCCVVSWGAETRSGFGEVAEASAHEVLQAEEIT